MAYRVYGPDVRACGLPGQQDGRAPLAGLLLWQAVDQREVCLEEHSEAQVLSRAGAGRAATRVRQCLQKPLHSGSWSGETAP